MQQTRTHTGNRAPEAFVTAKDDQHLRGRMSRPAHTRTRTLVRTRARTHMHTLILYAPHTHTCTHTHTHAAAAGARQHTLTLGRACRPHSAHQLCRAGPEPPSFSTSDARLPLPPSCLLPNMSARMRAHINGEEARLEVRERRHTCMVGSREYLGSG